MSVTRIIRFEADDGSVHLGEEPSHGALATILKGSLLDGTLERTDAQKTVKRLLSPLVCV